MSELWKRVLGVCPSTPGIHESLRAPFDSRAARASRMVEAAGVEPASERPVAAELYVRSRSCEFARGNKERRMRRTLARVISFRRAGLTSEPAC